MTELLPCPFCGERPTAVDDRDGAASISCENAECGIANIHSATLEDAAEFWNTRPNRASAAGAQEPVTLLTPGLMSATTVSCTGMEITIACNDHDTKDAIMNALVDNAYMPALAPPQPAAAQGEAEDWKDDPSADERWQAGCDFAMVQLCHALDVDPKAVRWDAATETLDGDVIAVIWNILRAKMGDDWDPDASVASAQGAMQPKTWQCLAVSKAACAWPDCGCDPEATKVIAALVEQGWEPPKSSDGGVESRHAPNFRPGGTAGDGLPDARVVKSDSAVSVAGGLVTQAGVAPGPSDDYEKRIREKVYASGILTNGEWVYLVGLFHTARDHESCPSSTIPEGSR